MDEILDRIKENGRKEGREEGKQESILEIAVKMLKDSQPMNLIMKYPGLTEEEIETAAKKNPVLPADCPGFSFFRNTKRKM